jgi:hypothetical protein
MSVIFILSHIFIMLTIHGVSININIPWMDIIMIIAKLLTH